MTTTDLPDASTPPPAAESRRLRRSRADRAGAGVAGGLGEYFGVDPVLFRVLFATSAFFGGAGILAYLIAWAVIPEQGTEHAPIDGWIGELRRRHVPVWVVVLGLGVALWAIAFSWWAPRPFVPVVVVAVILIVLVGRRGWRSGGRQVGSENVPPVSLMKSGPIERTWVNEARAWYDEAAARHRAKRRRALPLKVATFGTLVVTLAVLGIVDSISGVQIQTYFWVALGIVAGGLLVGALLRRTPWSVVTLLPVVVAGCVAFAGSTTQFGDGIGQREWRPTATSPSDYRLAFGDAVLDLRSLPADTGPRTFDLRLGAGRAEVIAPATMNLTINADIHIGTVSDASDDGIGPKTGVEFQRTVLPPRAASGAPITVNVAVADGELTVSTLG